MTREWVLFWSAMSVMAVALAAATYAMLAQPWEMGSIADWLAGSATLAAVVVALRTARQQGALAVQVAREDREERDAARLKEEIRLAKAMIFVAEYGRFSLQSLCDIAMRNPAMAKIPKVISVMEICRITSRSLQGFMTTHAPTTLLLQAVVEVEASWGVAVNCADLRVAIQHEDAEKSWATAMEQLDAACARLAARCVAHGVRPDFSDSVFVQRRLGQALQA